MFFLKVRGRFEEDFVFVVVIVELEWIRLFNEYVSLFEVGL